MKSLFAKTSNLARFLSGLSQVRQRAAAEASLMLVTSEPGYGKTRTLHWFATQEEHVIYLRAKSGWTRHWFYTDLLAAIKVVPGRYTEEAFRQTLQELAGLDYVIIIDEVEHALANGQVIEAIRDLSDLMEIPIVLVGMEHVKGKIARHAQISSRIAAVVEFKPADLADIQSVAAQLLDGVQIEEPLAQEILRQTKGRMREIMNALGTCERLAKKRKAPKVGLEDMAGIDLTFDWRAKRSGRVVPLEKAQ